MRHLLSILCLAHFLAPTELAAQSLNDLLQPIDGVSVCWEREYSMDHLSKHPRQKVTNIRFDLNYYNAEPDHSDQGEYAFSIAIQTRERSGSEGGLCHTNAEGQAICAIDCDGGAIEVRNQSAEDGSIYLTLLFGGLRLEECGNDEAFWLSAKPDDRVFLLHPVACEYE